MTKTTGTNPDRILWLQVGGLALMQGAITLCWVIYLMPREDPHYRTSDV